jgi:hypothetical protein
MRTLRAPLALFLPALGILLGTGPVLAQDATATRAEPYVRFVEADGSQGDGALQTAVATFRAPGRDQTIILYGVVHIAESEFYGRVQRDLDSYDTVLYEGVSPGKEAPTEADRSLSELQKAMGEMLGLTFQKDGIDYTRRNLVHADMNMDELKARMGGGTINPLGQFLSPDQMKSMAPFMRMFATFGKTLMQANPHMRDQLKLQMGRQLANQTMDALGGQMGEKMTQVILLDRNQVCFDVLQHQLETQHDGTIAIFYGAAHMPDMQRRLEAIGFQLQSKRWMSAWTMGHGVADDWTPPAGGDAPATPAPAPAPAVPNDGRRWF